MPQKSDDGVRFRSAFSLALPVVVGLLLRAAGARAAATPIPHGTLELIAENQWISAGRTVNLGLRFWLEKGWHIYWINPGDSGEPPRVTWQLPPGLTLGAMEWPAPRRLGTSTIVDFGYEDTVTLIVPLRAEAHLQAQQPAQCRGREGTRVSRNVHPGEGATFADTAHQVAAPSNGCQDGGFIQCHAQISAAVCTEELEVQRGRGERIVRAHRESRTPNNACGFLPAGRIAA